jgi:replication-associated recombination protein RarA
MPVLYRTYRPAHWTEVIGQDHIVQTLRESINSGRTAHAYLFSGTRGTGKTTVARILAHELKTAPEDITEIDAASNRGIDDIRELREHVATLPFSSRYKVYIIDEVHMLSKDAWNALLKTLEEPPAHVIFILATTELNKVPDTIVSRCQTFVFRTPNRDILGAQIISIAQKEGYTLDAGAEDPSVTLSVCSKKSSLVQMKKRSLAQQLSRSLERHVLNWYIVSSLQSLIRMQIQLSQYSGKSKSSVFLCLYSSLLPSKRCASSSWLTHHLVLIHVSKPTSHRMIGSSLLVNQPKL